MRHVNQTLRAATLLAALGLAWPLAARAECDVGERSLCAYELVVVVQDTANLEDVITPARHPGTRLDDQIPEIHLGLVTITDTANADAVRASLQADPDVERLDDHEYVDTPEGIQRSLGAITTSRTLADFQSQPALSAVHVPAQPSGYTGSGVVVAVIDGAVSLTNPILGPSALGPGIDALGGGPTVDVPPNGLDDDGDTLVDEEADHALHVGAMIHLVAPGAGLLFVRVLNDDGVGESFPMARGIVRAADAGARVMNISIGMPTDPSPIEKAVEYARGKGCIVVAGAGNRGDDPTAPMPCMDFPADRPEVIGVAAVDDAFLRPSWSSYGLPAPNPWNDPSAWPEQGSAWVSAPGVGLLAPHGTDGWATWDGTSFATPFVSGAVALLLEKYPGLTLDQVRTMLQESAQPFGDPSLVGPMGFGVVSVGAALALTAPGSTTRDGIHVRETSSGDEIYWGAEDGATSYDVVRGDLANVAVSGGAVNLGPLTCLAHDIGTPAVVDSEVPPSGHAFFYLVRDDGPDGGGATYGTDSLGELRMAGTTDCTW